MYRVKVEEIAGVGDVLEIPVAETATVYTKSFPMGDAEYYDMSALGAGTTLDVKIELQQSHVRPVTEGAVDTYWSESIADVAANHSVKTYLHYELAPKVAKYGRFVLTGQGSNSADVTMQLWVSKQGQI